MINLDKIILNSRSEIKKKSHQLPFLIELKVKKEDLVPGDLGTSNDIKEMIRIFGGVKEDIQMEVKKTKNTTE